MGIREHAVVKQKVNAKDMFTNELIEDVNKFDAAEVIAAAKANEGK